MFGGGFFFFITIVLLSILQTILARFKSIWVSLIVPTIWIIIMTYLFISDKIGLPVFIAGLIIGLIVLSLSRISNVERYKSKENKELEKMKKKDF